MNEVHADKGANPHLSILCPFSRGNNAPLFDSDFINFYWPQATKFHAQLTVEHNSVFINFSFFRFSFRSLANLKQFTAFTCVLCGSKYNDVDDDDSVDLDMCVETHLPCSENTPSIIVIKYINSPHIFSGSRGAEATAQQQNKQYSYSLISRKYTDKHTRIQSVSF